MTDTPPTPSPAFSYEHTDIPAGVTIRQWRAEQRTSRPRRRVLFWRRSR